MWPKFGAEYGNKLGSQLGPMSITKLSPNWAYQMGPIHFINFLLSGQDQGYKTKIKGSLPKTRPDLSIKMKTKTKTAFSGLGMFQTKTEASIPWGNEAEIFIIAILGEKLSI